MLSITAIVLPFLFLLLLLYAIWKRPNSNIKRDKKKMQKLTTFLTVGSLLPLLCTFFLGINEYKSNFTVEKWLTSDTGKVYMVDDLLDEYDLIEMTKDEVVSLLGKPSDTEFFKEAKNIVYYLGNERGIISIDSEWLVIDFDENMKDINYKVVAD
jgi:hypothetical protein